MRSIEESLKSEQCRRILEAFESGQKTTDELVKLCKLIASSIEKHMDVLVAADLVTRSRSGKISSSKL